QEKEKIRAEIGKRVRQVNKAFENVAINRKTINVLSAQIKDYWSRGKSLLEERKKILDYIGVKENSEMEAIVEEYQKPETHAALCRKWDLTEQKLHQLVQGFED